MPTRPLEFQTQVVAPVEYAGQWIAWDSKRTQILDHSESMQELWQRVQEKRIANPVFEKVPRPDVSIVGTL